jgi:hypothetical protein
MPSLAVGFDDEGSDSERAQNLDPFMYMVFWLLIAHRSTFSATRKTVFDQAFLAVGRQGIEP